MRVTRWNDALAVQIPADVARSLDLKEGDEVTVAVANEPSQEAGRLNAKKQALERIKALKLELPNNWKFDREEANAR
ncbi:AbrB/MazE/SpoVT family DNA-binding domain-containing protein [Rhizobiales bacterium RZME27]|jgi:antitoxin MazE|uniref:AbrB/MazE/SpoVT family DNA-binding domain-containing protein n=1 Tax=Endobacterium cereale TaxID=2663029 RepID=A0A6A8AAB6_9HYPH|nr:AbrB/MazE/SpoVT family DNA-binding domain-containing protein [Endobacterium cereale]MEB2846922.1 AbrB/MazE/SpoVT family DNA-binding domain-containing protein [Endobacterium cereale]MQY47659.1 AbrB/MazE/SpoVT family DNA-binding domain-containing protein [Endobacterium cereale]